MTTRRRNAPRLLLAGLRSVGGAAFLAPDLAVKSFHLEEGGDSRYLVRLFAARNIALTAGLLASNGSARRLWWQIGVVCDLLDAGAGLLGMRDGKEPSSAMVDTGASLVATGLGVAGLITERRA